MAQNYNPTKSERRVARIRFTVEMDRIYKSLMTPKTVNQVSNETGIDASTVLIATMIMLSDKRACIDGFVGKSDTSTRSLVYTTNPTTVYQRYNPGKYGK